MSQRSHPEFHPCKRWNGKPCSYKDCCFKDLRYDACKDDVKKKGGCKKKSECKWYHQNSTDDHLPPLPPPPPNAPISDEDEDCWGSKTIPTKIFDSWTEESRSLVTQCSLFTITAPKPTQEYGLFALSTVNKEYVYLNVHAPFCFVA
eukprot:PhF_6_TR42795/c0_g2_i1/m.64753